MVLVLILFSHFFTPLKKKIKAYIFVDVIATGITGIPKTGKMIPSSVSWT